MSTVPKKKAASQNCWEFWECPLDLRHKCPAFTLNAGSDCHNVAKNFCPRTKREFKNCWECLWYQKINHAKSFVYPANLYLNYLFIPYKFYID